MRKFFPAIAVLLLLVVATEALAPAQSSVRPCETKSLRFEGFCMVEDNCANSGFDGVCFHDVFHGVLETA
ncbi:Os04g0189950 [Oryza sativa Japonica Group]|uniref:Os04g0189950 protein n=1 Tax=Oryza sativa subsp. japonica TaxID=39947 RepID=C7J1E9_ORYSJ|nr:Os04g0189950 [Oryza sativa Japonica Group]|eukprot:NP_001173777.1 Os04g0189950 [Oryza sativa Japonica Group]